VTIENSFLNCFYYCHKGSGNPYFGNKTADPIQNVQEAVRGKGEICQLQLLHRKDIKNYVKNKNLSTALY
jgi:hypothetical protein